MGSTESIVPALFPRQPVAAEGDESLHAGVAIDRRRPGRPAEVSPHLLPLLRGAASVPVPPAPLVIDQEDRPRTPLAGIFNAILISSVLWCLIALAARTFAT